MDDFYNDDEGVLMSFISRSLLLLCNLLFMFADCAVFVTLYAWRDSCSLLYATVGCCLLYPSCTDCISVFYSYFAFDSHVSLICIHNVFSDVLGCG